MEKKNITEVVIDGSIYRLGGYESTEYLQQVASYLNNKITEMKALDGYGHLPTAQKALMLELNAADDYFKAKKSADHLEKELSDKDRELYSVKHDLVALQVKQEEQGRTIHTLRDENADLQKRILQLEASLRQLGKDPGSADLTGAVLPESGTSAKEISAADAPSDTTVSQEVKEENEKPSDLPAEEENRTSGEPVRAEDTGAVFRPGNFPEETEDEEPSAEKSGKTFVPGAAKREEMLRSARENFLQASGHSRKNHRRH